MKDRNPLVAILIVLGMLIAVALCWFSLSNSWGIIGYAEWEFQPLLHRQGVTEAFHLVRRMALLKMLLAIISTICMLFFMVKLLLWKKYGFWGFAITSAVATTGHVIMSYQIVKAFRLIGVDFSYSIPIQLAWMVAAIALLFVVLQFKKDGVSFWKQLE